MMRFQLFLLFPLFSVITLHAQTTTVQISTGLGYGKFCYYKLSDGATQQVNNDVWDLAFSNLGPDQAGIFVNESTSSSMGQTVPGVDAHFPFSIDFDQVFFATDMTEDNKIYNTEISWSEGAFNSYIDTTINGDYGWGIYNPATGNVEGTWVYVVKLRNGAYRKVFFETYNGTTYNFKSANLDGTDLQTHTVTKNPGNGSPVVYFSFANANPVTPVNWDLVFCRYITPLVVGNDVIPYAVAGILHNDGILSAKAIGIDPATVDYQDYVDSLQTRLDVVGHDWKYFSGTAWSILGDRAYFVKTQDNKLYKIVFTNFGGSLNGTATLQRTYLTELSSASDLPVGITDVAVFPNPAIDELQLAFTAVKGTKADIGLYNSAGQNVWNGNTQVQQGLNVFRINNLPALPSGVYTLSVRLPEGLFSRNVVLK